MKTKQPSVVKTVAKHRSIRNLMRNRIVEGQYAPGERIPNRDELMRGFGVSCVTIQRALDQLGEDGFVEANPGRGTFVADHPPHLCRYGLIFPMKNPRDSHEIRFYRLLWEAAERIQSEHEDVRFCMYTGMDGHRDAKGYPQLIRDVTEHRVAGLIFIYVDPELFAGTPILEEPGIVRVVQTNSPEALAHPLSVVHGNRRALIDMSLDYFVSRNRRRVAFVFGKGEYAKLGQYAASGAAARDMTCKPYWLQCPQPDPAEGGTCVQLLLNAAGEDRPNALVLMHEGLTETLVAGVFAAGIRVPDDLEVVSHCDFPAAGNNIIPIRRIGHDARDFIEAYLRVAREQAQGQFHPLTLISPKFEEDYNPNNSAARDIHFS